MLMIVFFFQYLQLARSLRFYGYLQFKPCITNYPEEGTRVIISVGDRELHFRLQTPDVSELLISAFCVGFVHCRQTAGVVCLFGRIRQCF